MIIRTAFLVVSLTFTGCAVSNVEISRNRKPQTTPARPIGERSVPFDNIEPVVAANQQEAAIISDYIGLSVKEAMALAKKQNRMADIGSRNNGPSSMTAIWAPGRILFSVNDGYVTNAEFPCGLIDDSRNHGVFRSK